MCSVADFVWTPIGVGGRSRRGSRRNLKPSTRRPGDISEPFERSERRAAAPPRRLLPSLGEGNWATRAVLERVADPRIDRSINQSIESRPCSVCVQTRVLFGKPWLAPKRRHTISISRTRQ